MASGTGFYHLGTRAWDEELCQACGVTIRRLGELDDLAEIRAPLFAELRGLPVFTALGDGATSNLGSGADRPGLVALNLGTSAAVREIVPAGKSRARARFGLFRHVVDDARCVIGGAISNAGNLREWMLRELKVSPNDEKALDRAAAAASPLVVQPSWVNERAPTWPEDVRGAIAGFTPATTAADLLRAATAASYYRLADILDLLCDGRHPELVVSGGVLHSPAALHLLADCLGHDLRACPELESSLRGGAIHALTELGLPAPHLGPGKIIRHRPALAAQHRLRRRRQREFERRLA